MSEDRFTPFANPPGVANEILHRLYLGDQLSAREKKFDRRIDVRGLVDPDDPGGVYVPMLDALAHVIHCALERYETVLVHCWAGIERSGLTIAWYMVKYRGYETIEDAYTWIQDRRQCVMRRTEWLHDSDTLEDDSILYRGI